MAKSRFEPDPNNPPRGIRRGIDGRFYWEFKRKHTDGRTFRKGGALALIGDAIKARSEAEREFTDIESGAAVMSGEDQTLQEWIDYCLTSIMPHGANRRGVAWTANTLRGYKQIADHDIKPLIGDVRLSRLGVDHVNSLMVSLANNHQRKHVKDCLSSFLQLAERQGKRAANSNPCRMIPIGRVKTERTSAATISKYVLQPAAKNSPNELKRVRIEEPIQDGLIIQKQRVLTFDEEDRLIEFVKDHETLSHILTPIMLGLKAGLRVGETVGLNWAHVDFESNAITIEQQAQRITGKGVVIDDPKSDAGTRSIPMSTSLRGHLATIRMKNPAALAVCNHTKGGRLGGDRYAEALRILCDDAGLGSFTDGRNLIMRPSHHDLRRTFLTRLASGNVARDKKINPIPPQILILISGHEDIETLLSYYTVGNPDDVRAAIDQLD
jgi:integrase